MKSYSRKLDKRALTTPDIAVVTAPRPGMNFAIIRTRVPKRANRCLVSDTQESGSRLRRHIARRTRLPKRRPDAYQARSASRHAATAAAAICAETGPPRAAQAPATINTGYVGNGKPTFSSRTRANTAGIPMCSSHAVSADMTLSGSARRCAEGAKLRPGEFDLTRVSNRQWWSGGCVRNRSPTESEREGPQHRRQRGAQQNTNLRHGRVRTSRECMIGQ